MCLIFIFNSTISNFIKFCFLNPSDLNTSLYTNKTSGESLQSRSRMLWDKLKFNKSWSYQFDHQTMSFGRLKLASSLLGLISQSQAKTCSLQSTNRLWCFHIKATICWHWSVTDISIVFCRETLIHCPLGKTSGTLVLNTVNKTISQSLQSRNVDFRMPWDKLNLSLFFLNKVSYFQNCKIREFNLFLNLIKVFI